MQGNSTCACCTLWLVPVLGSNTSTTHLISTRWRHLIVPSLSPRRSLPLPASIPIPVPPVIFASVILPIPAPAPHVPITSIGIPVTVFVVSRAISAAPLSVPVPVMPITFWVTSAATAGALFTSTAMQALVTCLDDLCVSLSYLLPAEVLLASQMILQ